MVSAWLQDDFVSVGEKNLLVVAGGRKCSVAIWELACDESGGGW